MPVQRNICNYRSSKRYLQSINVDFGNALQMVDSAVLQLQEMRKIPNTIIEQAKTEFEGAEWRATRIRRRRMMDGELQHDQPADTAENQWKRETFYCVLDAILRSFWKESTTFEVIIVACTKQIQRIAGETQDIS